MTPADIRAAREALGIDYIKTEMTTMTQMTNESKETAIREMLAAHEGCALAQIGSVDDICWLEPKDVVVTRDTFADFVSAHGQPQISRTFGEDQVFIWSRVQFRAGQTRQTLYLVERADGVNASFFG